MLKDVGGLLGSAAVIGRALTYMFSFMFGFGKPVRALIFNSILKQETKTSEDDAEDIQASI